MTSTGLPFIDTRLVHEVAMDSEEPEQFVHGRVPTHYRIRYFGKRWHRVYSRGFGRAYIVFANIEHLIDDATMKRLTDLVPTGSVVNREQDIQESEHAPEMREGLVRGYTAQQLIDSKGIDDDDIPF